MNLNEEEKILLLEILLKEEHQNEKELEKELRNNNIEARNSLNRRIDKIDNIIDKIKKQLN